MDAGRHLFMVYAVPVAIIKEMEAAARAGRSIDGLAEYMPPWLKELAGLLDQLISAERRPDFRTALVAKARDWHVLDAAAWDRIHAAFLVACIAQALKEAEAVQPQRLPAYRETIEAVCNDASAAVAGQGDLAAAHAAAWPWSASEGPLASQPPDMPAEATWAAKCAAEAAWAASAGEPWGTNSAAHSAAVVIWGDPGAWAANAWSLVGRLFSLFNAEFATAKGWRAPLRP